MEEVKAVIETIEKLDQKVIDVWFHYEEIAMHFNGLLIQFRLQLFGTLGALGALFGYLVGHDKSKDKNTFIKMRAYIVTALLWAFVAAAILDLLYYRILLEGSVKAILELEKLYPAIRMSTYIEDGFSWEPMSIVWMVYLMAFVPLALLTIYSWWAYFFKMEKQQ